jgi:lipid-binding SYLF domain-containing protein
MLKMEQIVTKVATPINRQTARLGCESFTPSEIDKECEKAVRILKELSACEYQIPVDTCIPLLASVSNSKLSASAAAAQPMQQNVPSNPNDRQQPYFINIAPSVLSHAAAILIFTTARFGIGHLSGSTGSGLLLTRAPASPSTLDDGTVVVPSQGGEWDRPVPVRTYSLGMGPLAFGADVSDRVYIFETRESLDMFMKARFLLGPEVTLAAGTYGGGAGVTFNGTFVEAWKNRRSARAQGENGGSCGCRCRHTVASETSPLLKEDTKTTVDEKQTPLIDIKADKAGSEPPIHPPAYSQNVTAAAAPSQEAGTTQTSRFKDSLGKPVYCYTKSKGLYAGLQAEMTMFIVQPVATTPSGANETLAKVLREAEGR